MIRDDYDQLDIDVPIPYTLTAAGRRDLAQWREDARFESCSHTYKLKAGVLACEKCDLVRELPRSGYSSIPGYLKGDTK